MPTRTNRVQHIMSLCAIAAATTMFATIPVNAFSQDLFSAESDIEEIVVTTRKREENLQEVPISVGVFTAEDIARMGIRGLDDITKLSPSLQFDKSFSANSVRVTMRGLSNTRGRTNVAFLVDGIDVTSETTGTNAGSPMLVNQRLLADVERIEVVRGPQSALYGRSAFAGAINYVSKNPGDELEGNIAVDFADHDKSEVSGGVSIPVSDTLGLRLSGVYWDDGGYYRNEVSGNKFGGGDGYGLAATGLWKPTDAFSLKTRLTWTDEDYDPSTVANLSDREIFVAVPADAASVTDETEVSLLPEVGNSNDRHVLSSEDVINGGEYPGSTLEVFRGSMNADWVIKDNYILTSISGFTNADMTQRYDLDRLALGRPDQFLGHGDVDTYGTTKQYSQELRLTTTWDNLPVDFTFGGQWWYENRDDHARNIASVCLFDTFCGEPGDTFESWQDIYNDAMSNSLNDGNYIDAEDYRDPKEAETNHGSFYVMFEWDMTDSLQLTLEDRFVSEHFEVDLYVGASCINAYPVPPDFNLGNLGQTGCFEGWKDGGSVRSTYQTPKVTLDWAITDSAMLYASAGKGQKPAGISLLTLPVPFEIPLYPTFFYEPEKMWSYEVGTKTSWSGSMGNLLFNASAFYQDYSDKQTNTQQQVGIFIIGVVTNASSASVKGLELETTWETPIEGLSLGAAYTRLDTEYDDFKDPTRSAERITIAGTCGDIVVIRGNDHCTIDLSGNKLEYAPENSVVLTGRFGRNLFSTGMDWHVESNASYQSKRYTSADNYTQLDSYWLVDLRLGLDADNWDVTAYVTNLFDDNAIKSSGGAFNFPAWAGANSAVSTPDGLPIGYMPNTRTGGVRARFFFE